MPRITNIGELNQRVTLQLQGPARNDLGERTDVWTDVATVWAKVAPLQSRAQFAAGQAQRPTTHVVTIRYRADILGPGKWRLQHHARGGELVPMEIDGAPIEVDAGGAFIEISAVKGLRDGR